jgi:predicted RNA binding protein YcfA (HicA-like mRNA interferase family)
MRLPRDVDGEQLVLLLRRYGYEVTRRSGSHIRLTTQLGGEHHVTIPAHNPLRLGTLNGILREVADHLNLSREALIESLWSK